MPTAFPLAWPLARPRTPADERRPALFRHNGRAVSIAVGRKRVLDELDAYTRAGRAYRVPLDTVVISTNVRTYTRGGVEVPYSDQAQAREDPGVAVYFTLDGVPICLPCDAWDTVGANLAAVAAHISALRGIERWGVGTTADHYSGFLALPAAGGGSGRAWWEELGCAMDADEAAVRAAYKARLHAVHPDKPGGDRDAFEAVQAAYRQGMARFTP